MNSRRRRNCGEMMENDFPKELLTGKKLYCGDEITLKKEMMFEKAMRGKNLEI
jgi:hypothetical protein